ncbi:uncharacterized protein LOC136089849 [Hydra vulgaris]|uniref:Uncharacterized protein LOC136089849 n=1 Tax=Hydra vulgaris TaxID=6087 RepID=A0ABM4DC81_HYDVU
MYGSETWAMNVEDVQCLERTEKKMIRWMFGVTLKDKKRSHDLRLRLGIVSVYDIVRQGRLRWFGHLERKDADDWVSACKELEVLEERVRSFRRVVVEKLRESVLHMIQKVKARKCLRSCIENSFITKSFCYK